MTAFFQSGHAVDLVLSVLVLEILAYALWRGRVPAARLVLGAVPGACLLLALRAALTGAAWEAVAFWLTLSFPAHLADLWRRAKFD